MIINSLYILLRRLGQPWFSFSNVRNEEGPFILPKLCLSRINILTDSLSSANKNHSHFFQRISKIPLLICLIALGLNNATAQTNESIDSGSYVINMGIVPQTISNGLKPYGLVYELIHTHGIPVKWVINPAKLKDGIDFSHNGIDYKGGPFIIPAIYRSAAVNAAIATWNAKGVVGAETVSDIVVPVFSTLNYFVIWTLDEQNGKIAEEYFVNAEIPESAYNWLDPSELSCCNDIFIIPHADPEWSSHNRLYYWNESIEDGGCQGAIWAGCHAVSAMEALFNPSDPTEKMNFLSSDPGLVLWGDHDDGTLHIFTINTQIQ